MASPIATSRSRFLDMPALAALAHRRFVTRHQIEGAHSGRHRSRTLGGAGEFADYREYVDGEDLRRLDWKVLARTGRAYTRLYQDETNLMCTLVIDASGSMLFGGDGDGDGRGSKLEYAQYLTTALSQLIGRQQDQVGLAVVADRLRDLVGTGSTSEHVARVQEKIEALRTWPVTDLEQGLRELFDRLHRRGVLMVISDFLVEDVERAFGSIRLFRQRGWEVILLHLVHPEEERLPEGVAYRFEGLENDGRVNCSPQEIREAYAKRFEAHAAAVRAAGLAVGCDYRRVSTKVSYLQTLGGFLVDRSG